MTTFHSTRSTTDSLTSKQAIRKGIEAAKKNMITVTLSGSTIPHETIGEAGAGRVLMKPAAPGTGVIAGGPMRAVLEAMGVRNVLAMAYGSTNPYNMVRATIDALSHLSSPADVAAKRGMTVEQILA